MCNHDEQLCFLHNAHPQLEMKGRKKPYKYILSVTIFVLYDLPILKLR
jgi:hypothetical protein